MKIPKKTGRWMLFLCLGSVLLLFMSGSDGFISLYQSHLKDRKIKEEIEEIHTTIDSLKLTIEKLKSDTLFIEKIAREKLGMARKDERIYKFIEEK